MVLGKVNQDVNEDQIIFLMNDKKHDVPFIELCELCNSHLLENYAEERVSITHDVSTMMAVFHSSNVSKHLLFLLFARQKQCKSFVPMVLVMW